MPMQPSPEQSLVEQHMAQESDTAYDVLDEIQEMLADAGGELDMTTQRDEVRKICSDMDAVERVRILVQELIDPRGVLEPQAAKVEGTQHIDDISHH